MARHVDEGDGYAQLQRPWPRHPANDGQRACVTRRHWSGVRKGGGGAQATHPKLSILADVEGSPTIWPNVFLEEMKHLPTIFRLMRALEKIAVVADAGWIRTAAKIESKLIPGIEYQVFTREEAAQARAWIMGEAPPPPAQ
ncbi:MAG: STAS/SEC14 domain-containing protein [Sphingobium sp.]|nr:STAS/SEC14 domain-containing protein [Sphingobium sp.]